MTTKSRLLCCVSLTLWMANVSANQQPPTSRKGPFVWFVFLGGSAESPAWTVRKACHVDESLLVIYPDQLGAQLAVLKMRFGIDQVICSTDYRTLSINQVLQSSHWVKPQEDNTEAQCGNLIEGLRSLKIIPPDAVLELQCPVECIVNNGYASGYSDESPVLGIVKNRVDGLLRLCKITANLVKIASRTSDNAIVDGDESTLWRRYTLEEIEGLWKNEILGRHGLKAEHVKVWKSLCFIEIRFEEDVPLIEWMPAIAGRILSK